jgi:hypothetical protein
MGSSSSEFRDEPRTMPERATPTQLLDVSEVMVREDSEGTKEERSEKVVQR